MTSKMTNPLTPSQAIKKTQEKTIAGIVGSFNFDKCRNHMVQTGWTWANTTPPNTTPSIEALQAHACSMLRKVLKTKNEHSNFTAGGFHVERYRNRLELSFAIEFSGGYVEVPMKEE